MPERGSSEGATPASDPGDGGDEVKDRAGVDGGDGGDEVEDRAGVDGGDDGNEVDHHLDASAPIRPRSTPRLVAGVICLLVAVIVAVLAVRAASDDDTDASATTTTAVQLAGTTPDGAATTVPSPGWPEAVRGRPQQFGPEGPPPGSAGDLEPGWYLWSDFHDWHLWLVGGEGVDASAVVTTNAALTLKSTYGDAEVAPAEGSATVRRGASTAPIAGIDFNPGFYGDQITVTVTGDLPLHTGQGATEATSPLALERRPET